MEKTLYKEFEEFMELFDKYIQEHPEVIEESAKKHAEQFADVKDIAIGDKNEFFQTRDCHKCVYEVGCHGNPANCKYYKRDAPDGGYYG